MYHSRAGSEITGNGSGKSDEAVAGTASVKRRRLRWEYQVADRGGACCFCARANHSPIELRRRKPQVKVMMRYHVPIIYMLIFASCASKLTLSLLLQDQNAAAFFQEPEVAGALTNRINDKTVTATTTSGGNINFNNDHHQQNGYLDREYQALQYASFYGATSSPSSASSAESDYQLGFRLAAAQAEASQYNGTNANLELEGDNAIDLNLNLVNEDNDDNTNEDTDPSDGTISSSSSSSSSSSNSNSNNNINNNNNYNNIGNDEDANRCADYETVIAKFPHVFNRVIYFTFYAIILTIGLIGNTVTLCAMWRKWDKLTVMDIFIGNLALSDIMLCVFAVPITPIYMLYYGEWVFGVALCKIFAFAQGASVYISTLTMLNIAYIRYQLILNPHKKQMTKFIAFLLSFCTWVIGFAITSPYVISINLLPAECAIKFCDEHWDDETNRFYFSVITLTLQFVLPFVGVSFSYGSIFARLRKRQLEAEERFNRINELSTGREDSTGHVTGGGGGVGVGGGTGNGHQSGRQPLVCTCELGRLQLKGALTQERAKRRSRSQRRSRPTISRPFARLFPCASSSSRSGSAKFEAKQMAAPSKTANSALSQHHEISSSSNRDPVAASTSGEAALVAGHSSSCPIGGGGGGGGEPKPVPVGWPAPPIRRRASCGDHLASMEGSGASSQRAVGLANINQSPEARTRAPTKQSERAARSGLLFFWKRPKRESASINTKPEVLPNVAKPTSQLADEGVELEPLQSDKQQQQQQDRRQTNLIPLRKSISVSTSNLSEVAAANRHQLQFAVAGAQAVGGNPYAASHQVAADWRLLSEAELAAVATSSALPLPNSHDSIHDELQLGQTGGGAIDIDNHESCRNNHSDLVAEEIRACQVHGIGRNHNHHHHHHHHHQHHQHNLRSAGANLVGSAANLSAPGNSSSSSSSKVILAQRERRQREKDKRLSQTNTKLLFMVVLFVFSWLPLNSFNLAQDYFDWLSESPYVKDIFMVVHIIACSSACYNPILYAWMSDNYRQELLDVLPNWVVVRFGWLLGETSGSGKKAKSSGGANPRMQSRASNYLNATERSTVVLRPTANQLTDHELPAHQAYQATALTGSGSAENSVVININHNNNGNNNHHQLASTNHLLNDEHHQCGSPTLAEARRELLDCGQRRSAR